MSKRNRQRGLAAAVFLWAAGAWAYPTSVVFVPTGDVHHQGEIAAFVYSSWNYDPQSSPAGGWLGVEAGVLPAFSYGASGTGFGGLELGIDAVNPSDYPGDASTVKPIVNLKAQLLTESGWIPHLALGTMDLQLFRTARSGNVVYAAATHSLAFGGRDCGRVTVGFGDALTGDRALFRGTAPFAGDSEFLLAGYESPAFGPFSFGIDYFGGVSELSSTNVSLNLVPIKGGTVAVGGFFSNDRSVPSATYDGLFADVVIVWDALAAAK